jgi:hypothetical protein
MKKVQVLFAAVAVCAALSAGCKQVSSWELAKEAFQETDTALFEQKIVKALERAEEQMRSDPKNVRPYMVKGSIYAIKREYEAAIDAMKAGLESAEIPNEQQRSALHEYIITFYYESGEVNMLKAGVEYVKKLILSDGEKDYYFYCLGCMNLKLYEKLGDGFYKSEANRYFLRTNLSEEPDIRKSLGELGLPDPFLK